MLQRLQTFILVAIITLFIWLIAEAQSLDHKSQLLQMQLTVPEQSNLVITSSRTSIASVKVELQGSTAALDRLVHSLGGTVRVVMDAPGEFTVNLQERLSQMPPFKGSGVSLRDVDPAFIERVVVQRRVTVTDVPVRIGAITGVELRDSPVISPTTVEVAVPEESLEAFQEARYVNIATDPSVLAELTPGRHTINVPLEIPRAAGTQHATITPSTAALTIDVRDHTETWIVGAPGSSPLPVLVQLPPDQVGRYRVRLEENDRFVDVTFTGPSQGIEQLRQDRARAAPFIVLTSDDLARGVTSATLHFRDLPPGVTATPARTSVAIEIIDMNSGT